MALSYPLAMPTVTGFRATEMLPVPVVGFNRSPTTGQQQIYEWPGQWLQFNVTLPAMHEAAAGDWAGFFMALRGSVGTFLLGPSIRKSPRGIATGTPLVKGGSQVGNTLVTDGWTAGQTGIMKRGDWFQLGTAATSTLHRVVQDANSNGSGEATLEIFPGLRSSPADNAALTITNPKGLFRLASPVPEAYDSQKICDGMSFTAFDAIS
jgi:hypothetical protein